MRDPIVSLIISAFLLTSVGPFPAQAQEFSLPKPGVMVHLSPKFNPPVLKGIKVHTNTPFQFDFILDKGDSQLGNEHWVLKSSAQSSSPPDLEIFLGIKEAAILTHN